MNQIFDAEWYKACNPDVAQAGVDPIEHYEQHGWKEGRRPHPLFHPEFYADQAGISISDRNTLSHYTRIGWRMGYNPHPLFDVKWYLSRNEGAALSGIDPLAFYIAHGDSSGAPHPLFDPEWYLIHNQGTREPLLQDYVKRKGRCPHPLFNDELYSALAFLRESDCITPLEHYCTSGWRKGTKPNHIFDGPWYTSTYAAGSVNPLIHYVSVGCARRYNPHPLFDVKWYERMNVRELGSGQHAIYHFLRFGRKMGMSTHPDFDPRWYLERNPDVAASGLDPLEHLLSVGLRQGRNPHPKFGNEQYLLSVANED